MRLIYHSHDPSEAERLFEFLLWKQFEVNLEHSGDEGKVWIVDEEQIDEAHEWAQKFQADPRDPIFDAHHSILTSAPQPQEEERPPRPSSPTPIRSKRGKMGTLTSLLLFACVFFFILSELQRVTAPPPPDPDMRFFLFTPVEQAMLFDLPEKEELRQELLREYKVEQLNAPQTLEPATQERVSDWLSAKEWEGVYDLTLTAADGGTVTPLPPLFEKISEGEGWRFFTPCLLHGNLLHIFFNLLWLVLLGSQLEGRLGGAKYTAFIIGTGVFSNTAQYLVGGSKFLGLSGVILAMLAYIATRRKHAPWEGYTLPPGSVRFVGIFVLIFAGLQTAAFLLEFFQITNLGIGIANTAHLAGALGGWIVARSH